MHGGNSEVEVEASIAGYIGLSKTAKSLTGIQLSAQQLANFSWYAQELTDWNNRFNLTAITNIDLIEVKHFLDSLTCLNVMGSQPAGHVIDIGTGAGFPGLPLAIVCPQMRFTLIESNGKKVAFCRHVIQSLELEGVEVVHGRAEEVGRLPEHRQSYDWALARAVAHLPVLVEYLLPLLRIGGSAIAMKGETGPAEAQASEAALRILGGQLGQLAPIELPGVADTRYLVVIDKVGATPTSYPRRSGVPVKRPLGDKD